MLRIGAVTLAVLAAAVGTVAVSEAREATAGDWSPYHNERFGFRLEYPAQLFRVERTTEAGDGRVFAAHDGQARLLVGALSNQDHHSAKSYQDFLARTSYANYTITYRPLGDDWLVLSGEADGTIFYEKAVLSCGGELISSFALLYPADKRETFEPILARIANSFVPSSKPCRAGPGSASARQRPARPKPQAEASAHASPSARAPRAAQLPQEEPPTRAQDHGPMADQSARQRPARPNPQAEASARTPRSARAPRAAQLPQDEPLTRAHGYGPMADQIARRRGTDVIVIMRRTTPPYDYKYVRGYATR